MIAEPTYTVPFLYDILQQKSAPVTAPVSPDVPGSKSITNRALLLATLADGTSRLQGVLFSDDSRHFLKCIQELGFETQVDEAGRTISVRGLGGRVPLDTWAAPGLPHASSPLTWGFPRVSTIWMPRNRCADAPWLPC